LRREKALLRDGAVMVGGCDEVGRGALAGPVTVGVVLVDARTKRIPQGLTDSKLLTPERREALVPKIRRWATAYSVGHASPDEIDEFGLTYALRLAGLRALELLPANPDCVLLDGNFDWISYRHRGAAALLESDELAPQEVFWEIEELDTRPEPEWPAVQLPPVITQIKADLACASVSAASVLAKTTRDALMRTLAERFPHYGWHENKGYTSDYHRDEIRRSGPCEHHRRSWRLLPVEVDESIDVAT
jgi:ribonuclease HII